MGKFLDALRQRQAEIRQGRNQPVPDYTKNIEEGLEYQAKINDLLYIENHIYDHVKQTFASMDPARQDSFYDNLIKEDKKAGYTKDQFHQDIQNGNLEGIISGSKLGAAGAEAEAALDALLTEEESEALSQAILNQKTPRDPEFPKELKNDTPYKGRIEELRNDIPANDPQGEKKKQILDQAGEILEYGSEDTLKYLERQYSSFTDPKIIGIDDTMDMIGDLNTLHFIENTLEGGKYKEKFPSGKGNNLPKRYHCRALDPASSTMTDQDIEDLRQHKTGISQELKNTVTGVINRMDQIGENSYRNPQTTIMRENEDGSPRIEFRGEQGTKHYAFWPLVTTKMLLGKAIEKGDYEAAEKHIAEYNRIKTHTDEIMKAVQYGPKLFGGNVESTRNGGADVTTRNGVPVEYLEDTVGHNKANGLYCLFAYCKSNDQKAEDVLEDPIGALDKASERYRKIYGISAKGNTGKLLVKAFSKDDATNLEANFDNQIRSLGHGLDAVASMAKSDEERERITGLTQVATGTAMYGIRKEENLWVELAESGPEKQDLLFMHAALIPEEDFDLVDIASKMVKPDWEKKLDPSALIEDLRSKGKLDYGKLADQADHILSEAEKQADKFDDKNIDSQFNSIRFRKAAAKAYDTALKTASPQERETEGYRRLQQKSIELKNGAWADALGNEDISNDFNRLNEEIDALGRQKTGLFVDKTDSPEHQRMMQQLRRVQNKVRLLKGEEVQGLSDQEREELEKADLSSEIHKARLSTYEYQRLKTENGTKTKFWYSSGSDRADSAGNALALLDDIEKKMETQEPAVLMMQKAQRDLVRNLDGNQRTDANISRTAAKLMCGMMMVFDGKSPAQQNAVLKNNSKMESRINKIQSSREFQHMMHTEGPKKIAEYIAEGGSKLTDAYIRASNEIKTMEGKQGKAPEAMNAEEKMQMWKEQGQKHEQEQPQGPAAPHA